MPDHYFEHMVTFFIVLLFINTLLLFIKGYRTYNQPGSYIEQAGILCSLLQQIAQV